MALPGAPGSVPGTYRNKSTFAAPGRATGSGAVRTQTTLFFSLATFSLSAFSVAQAESGLASYDGYGKAGKGGPVGRSKSPGYGHLKLPHLMIAVSAAEQQ
ncbi:hypothetical protein ACVIJW_002731 [Bradyrhizobium barranii subsp. barranii]